MKWLTPKNLIVAAAVIIALLLCCGVASCVTGAPSVGEVDFDHKPKKKKSTKKKSTDKKSTTKKRSMEAYDTVLAGHFHTRTCTTCHV